MDASQILQEVESKPKKKSETKLNNKDESFNNVMDSISKNWSPSNKTSDSEEIERLKRELKTQEQKIKTLEKNRKGFSKNEEKLLAAIRSEAISQNTETPQISSRTFRSVYKISSDYFRPSIENLLTQEIIERIETKFAGKISTYRWRILK